MFIIAESYYDLLRTFVEEYVPKFSKISLENEQDLIYVDLDKREMTLPPNLSTFMAIAGDHRSETVYFIVDRFFEDVDLSHLSCAVEYINAKGQLRLYPVILKDIQDLYNPFTGEVETNKLILSWCLGSEVTNTPGEIKFALYFFKINHNTNSLSYSLRTKDCIGVIAEGLNKDPNNDGKTETESNEYNTIPEDHISNIYDAIEQAKYIYWNNV